MMGRSHALLGVAGFSSMLTVAYKTTEEGFHLTDTSMIPVNGQVLVWSTFAAAAIARVTLSNIPRKLERAADNMEENAPSIGTKMVKGVAHGFGSVAYGALHKVLIFLTLILMTVFVGMTVGVYGRFLLPNTPWECLLWVAVAAGWALFPDIDEPNSTVSRLFGVVSMAASKIIRGLAGGHRVFTHQWPMAVIMGGVAVLAAWKLPILAGIMMTVAMILAARMIFPDSLGKQSIPVMLVGITFVWMATLGSVSLWPLALAVPCGILLHDMGDYVTNSGIAFAWPSKVKYAAKLFATGSFQEVWVVRPILAVLSILTMSYLVVLPAINNTNPSDVGSFFQTNYPGVSSFYQQDK